MSNISVRAIWIEAEHWAAGEWDPVDDNSDVIVELVDGQKWAATFITYRNILSLSEKYKETGECLGGAYFWATDMVLVDELTRQRIEDVVRDLIEAGDFESAFDPVGEE